MTQSGRQVAYDRSPCEVASRTISAGGSVLPTRATGRSFVEASNAQSLGNIGCRSRKSCSVPCFAGRGRQGEQAQKIKCWSIDGIRQSVGAARPYYQGGVMAGPLYNGQDYLGNDPDPNIRAYLMKDMTRYGGED
jgi:hypothetical protein